MVNKVVTVLDGLKTYIAVAAAVASVLGYAFGAYDREVMEILLSLFGLGSVAALRHGIAKSQK
jgi:hypothetical protein